MKIPVCLKKPEQALGKQILAIGFSPFLILATDSLIIIALNAVLQYYGGAGYGDTLITAATIVQSYMLLITSPMLGVTSGSQPLISFNYGAGKPKRIRQTVFWVLLLCIGFTATMFFCVQNASSIFCKNFYRRKGIPGTGGMGNPGIYNDDHSSELSVCICRCADGAWHDKGVIGAFAASQIFISGSYLCSAVFLCGPSRVLCGADGRCFVGDGDERVFFNYI